MKLYPIKFKPRLKERVWGGDRLATAVGKKVPAGKKIGESWELSGLHRDVSVGDNGYLKGNNLQELIEVYMGELVGDSVYEKYGEEFPVLIKLIDAEGLLSVQVHPGDELAGQRHNAYGKNELWYVIDCAPGAVIYAGWKREVDEREYLDAVAGATVQELMNKIEVKPGDAFFVPAGTIHAMGGGLLLAEVQQTSDITYRIYDWDRLDDKGQLRELHTDMALEALKFGRPEKYDVTPRPVKNEAVEIKDTPWFTVNLIELDGNVSRRTGMLDSFVVYLCVDGQCTLSGDEAVETLKKGETVLIPADMDGVELSGKGRLLEVYVNVLQ